MRLTTLLDTVNQGGSGPWPPDESPTISAADERFQFDRVLADLIPCRSGDPELWFAEQNVQVERAKALCRGCPVLEGCLAGAIDRGEPWGVWGGAEAPEAPAPRVVTRGVPQERACAAAGYIRSPGAPTRSAAAGRRRAGRPRSSPPRRSPRARRGARAPGPRRALRRSRRRWSPHGMGCGSLRPAVPRGRPISHRPLPATDRCIAGMGCDPG